MAIYLVLLLARGFQASCADLTRVGWIAGLLPSALSPEYFKGELTPAKTLKVTFFFFLLLIDPCVNATVNVNEK